MNRGAGSAASSWDARYRARGRIWGDEPSEAARFLIDRFGGGLGPDSVVADLGCGYGRDSVAIAEACGCRVVGIDESGVALELARRSATPLPAGVTLRAQHIEDVTGAFDAVLAANLYHLLGPEARRRLAADAARITRPGGLLVLNAMAVGDPEEYGVGDAVAGEPDSFVEGGTYRHFATRDELEAAFPGFAVEALELLAFDEPHEGAATHHHTTWLLAARRV